MVRSWFFFYGFESLVIEFDFFVLVLVDVKVKVCC